MISNPLSYLSSCNTGVNLEITIDFYIDIIRKRERKKKGKNGSLEIIFLFFLEKITDVGN